MISSTYFKKYLGDWILCIVLQLYVLIFGLRTTPFLREFNLKDPSIQHPFTTHEQVSDILCLVSLSLVAQRYGTNNALDPSYIHPWRHNTG
jgi:hypothetical protein